MEKIILLIFVAITAIDSKYKQIFGFMMSKQNYCFILFSRKEYLFMYYLYSNFTTKCHLKYDNINVLEKSINYI